MHQTTQSNRKPAVHGDGRPLNLLKGRQQPLHLHERRADAGRQSRHDGRRRHHPYPERRRGNDVLISVGGSQTLNGGDGNDSWSRTSAWLRLGLPAPTCFNGGNGIDTLGLDAPGGTAITKYTVDLAASTGSIAGAYASSFTLSGIENVDGSDVADYIAGDAGANLLQGWSGNDTMIAAPATTPSMAARATTPCSA